MAKKLKVNELRAKLAERGLVTTGLKPVLVERLEEAIAQDAKTVKSKSRRKRDRDSSDSTHDSNKLIAIGEFRAMNVKELRKEASKRGLATTGTKKELLERLCNDEAQDDKNGLEEEKSTKKGAAVLDQWIPDHGDDVYDAMLNQTNVRDNSNKFFVLQVLESDNRKTYMVHFRWGRVGTRNHWSDRKEFVLHPKSYAWLEVDYGKEENDSVNDIPKSSSKVTRDESKLDPQVSKFMSLICSVSMMAQQMMELGYNAKELPLGKLSKSNIKVLQRISEMIERYDRARLEELSGEFYTVIPHDFGFKKMCQFVIDTPQKLKQKIEMVEALGEIEFATKLLSIDQGLQDDPLYYHYQQLNCELTPVGADSEEFSMVAKYMENTHTKADSGYTVEIIQLFRASRAVEADRFQQFSSSKNRMLLWHGSRLTNWVGILSQGLRIAPREAPVTGYRFGKGVYFADMFSKSANYCYANSGSNDGVLLLCEVALGDVNELIYPDYEADNLPPGKLSTKGVGKTAPNGSEAKTLEEGVVVPLGKPEDHSSTMGMLLYNEYIVYNTEQIKMRYVIQVKFNYK
ncbi:BnaA02g36520D [Brassica napus]|uniref:Poly [ADP-ribose] polymerase n=1 Tax=Brassica napus TaxID=3708 RepID=A0A078IYC8_BRANA|nr:BnaA02g36520D [Brassica napus]